MWWRDVPAYGLLFFTYDHLCNWWIKREDSDWVVYSKKMLASGISGVLNWLPSYPLDVVKSIVQTH